MQNLPAPSGGTTIFTRGERWRVLRSDTHGPVRLLRLQGAGGANAGERLSLIVPFDRVEHHAAGADLRVRARHDVLRHAASTIGHARTWDVASSAVTARIDLLPFQFEALQCVLHGHTRLLLADAVGLGKTIQAGLVIAELLDRGLASRVLVLTPASLRAQWASELTARFTLDVRALDHAALCRAIASLPTGSNPWAASPVIISSIDLVKRAEVMAALDGVPIDLLVVDEAHHAAPGTDRGALVDAIARRATWVVLATATPHSGDTRAFDHLTSVGGFGRDAMHVIRRSALEVLARSRRREVVIRVRPAPAEAALLRAVRAYVDALRSAPRDREAAALLATVFERRASSSAHALGRTTSRRAALLASRPAAPACERQSRLPWEEQDDADDVEPDTLLGAPALEDRVVERRHLDAIASLIPSARACASKVAALARLLRRAGEPAVVFSEFRDTVLSLDESLAPCTTAVLHGGMEEPARRSAIEMFTSGRARVLLATDTAGEGLNLHHRCRVVVHFEPAWSHVRVEQRAGRVDRIGQRRRAHAVHFVLRDTIEATVLARRGHRAGIASLVVPEQAAGASGTGVVEELRLRRRALALTRGLPPAAGPCCARGTGTRGAVILLFEVPWFDADEGGVEEQLVALRVELGCAVPRRRDQARAFYLALSRAAPVRALVEQHTGHVARHATRPAAFAASWGRRCEGMLCELAAARSRELQPALFDRRAVSAAAHDLARHVACESHLRAGVARAAALERLCAASPVLIAAWPEGQV